MNQINMYENRKKIIENLFEGETNFITNASNFASYIFYNIPDVSWAGFYMTDGKELILGPFSGKPACVRIGEGKGVCGSSFKKGKSIIVDNVSKFPGYIACDPECRSEIVVPLVYNGTVCGVLDLDSPTIGRFRKEDRSGLESMVEILIKFSNMEDLKKYYKFP